MVPEESDSLKNLQRFAEDNLPERWARCYMCKKERPSVLAAKEGILEPKPERDMDIYYCGCRGWD